MKRILFYPLALSLILLSACKKTSNEATITSPDGSLTLSTKLTEGKIYYSLLQGKDTLVLPSSLGFILKEGILNDHFTITGVSKDKNDETWTQPWGEEEEVRNHYNELTLHLARKADGTERKLDVIFRLFDDGLGFRYHLPKQEGLNDFTIMDETTEVHFPFDAQTWSIPTHGTSYYEGKYTCSPLSQKDTISTPFTMEVSDTLLMALHEANLTDYSSLNYAIQANHDGTVSIHSDLVPLSSGEKVIGQAPFSTPWRTIIVAKNAGDLSLSRLMLNLNEPNAIGDTSWIEPGRYIGIWWGMHTKDYTWDMGPKHGATTANTKRYIDFAAKHGFSGVLVEGWNKGWGQGEGPMNYLEAYPDYNLEELTNYAREKGVRIIAHNETYGGATNYENQLDEAFALYEKLGINTVKTGYVNNLMDGKEHQHSQYGIRHYRKVIETAAKYHIMVDNHEPAMPTGLQRTYPNLMTQEGVRGQEYNAWSADGGNPPDHETIIPFTRGLAGPIDFTPGIFNFKNPAVPTTRVQTTIAKQLALYVVLYSPLQMAADMIENYENRPEFSFITSCPTTWSKTVYPNAKIGEYVITARKERGGERWFVGAITNKNARSLELSLSFLTPNTRYRATIYADGQDCDYSTNPYPVTISEQEVTSDTVLNLNLATSGGAALRIEPIK